jgi:hypothetical protein
MLAEIAELHPPVSESHNSTSNYVVIQCIAKTMPKPGMMSDSIAAGRDGRLVNSGGKK